MLPPGETRPILLHLPHLPDGVLSLLQMRLAGKCCGQHGKCSFCYTVILWGHPREVIVWQALGGSWCLLSPREEFALQALGPVLVPPPEEHEVGTLLLAVGRGIQTINEA